MRIVLVVVLVLVIERMKFVQNESNLIEYGDDSNKQEHVRRVSAGCPITPAIQLIALPLYGGGSGWG